MSLASRLAAFIGTLSLAMTLMAQSNGSITGTVKDTKGGVIQAATVTVSDPSNGVHQTTRTNDAGIFVFPELPPGTYSVVIETPGFKKTERNAVTVPISSKISLGDV